jgi:hypothetical protein
MPILADRALPWWTHAVPICPEARGESVHARPNTKGGPPGTVMFYWAYTHSLTYVVPPQLTLVPQLLGYVVPEASHQVFATVGACLSRVRQNRRCLMGTSPILLPMSSCRATSWHYTTGSPILCLLCSDSTNIH